MTFAIVTWLICGIAVWIKSLPVHHRDFNFMADVVLGLPLCLLGGPIFLLAGLFA